MPRPPRQRNLRRNPRATYFKPQGIPLRGLSVVTLSAEEFEALTLADAEDASQIDAAAEMHTSQSTFQRILTSARGKVARAVAYGSAIHIDHPAARRPIDTHTDNGEIA